MAVIGRFGPPVALMVVIFALSSRQDLDPGDGALGVATPVVAHLVEYGLLFLLWRRALGGGGTVLAAAIALLYGVTDELHQSTVPGRDASGFDVAVDAIGIAWAYLLLRASRARWP